MFDTEVLWGAPELGREKVPGRVVVKNGSIRAILRGEGARGLEDLALLRGTTGFGEPVVAASVQRGGAKFHPNRRLDEVTLYPRTLVRGIEGWCGDDTPLRQVTVEYRGLPKWIAARGGWKVEHRDDGAVEASHDTAVEPIEAVDPQGITVRIAKPMALAWSGATSFKVRSRVFTSFEAPNGVSWSRLKRTIIRVGRLLSLGSQHTISVRRVIIPAPEGMSRSSGTLDDVELAGTEPSGLARFPLLPYDRFRDQMGSILTSWLAAAGELDPMFDLFHSVVGSPDVFVEQRLLALAQACEIHHRRRVGETYLSDERFSLLLDELAVPLKGLEARVEKAFAGKLRHMNEVSLRRRVQYAARHATPTVRRLLGSPPRFAHEVADLRNHLTHYGDGERSDVTVNRAGVIGDYLELLVLDLIVSETGLEIEEREWISEHWVTVASRYRWKPLPDVSA